MKPSELNPPEAEEETSSEVVDEVGEVPTLETRLEQTTAELETTREQLTEARREIERVRRVTKQRAQEAERAAKMGALSSMLPVAENFDYALSSAEGAEVPEVFLTGLQGLKEGFMRALGQSGVEEIPAKVGDPIDADLHRVVAQHSSPDHLEGTTVVGHVQRNGYLLKTGTDVIALRPADVVAFVGTKVPEDPEAAMKALQDTQALIDETRAKAEEAQESDLSNELPAEVRARIEELAKEHEDASNTKDSLSEMMPEAFEDEIREATEKLAAIDTELKNIATEHSDADIQAVFQAAKDLL